MSFLNLATHPLSTVTSHLPEIDIPLSCRMKAPIHFNTDWISLVCGLDAAGSEVIYAHCRGESFLLSSTPFTVDHPVHRTYGKNWGGGLERFPERPGPLSVGAERLLVWCNADDEDRVRLHATKF